MLHSLLNPFLVSLFVSALLTRYVRNVAISRGWVDQPDSSRHLHSKPVPRLGGVAIFLSLMSLVGAALLAPKWPGLPEQLPAGMTLGILGPATLVFLTGLYDDVRSLGPYPKFGIQVLAALLLYANGFGIRQFDLFRGGHDVKGIVGLLLTILWVLLITNAFNLIDGLDGLAAGSALFSTLVVFVISLLAANHLISFLAVVLAGAILGFLRFNFNPATIFLGDSGSLFIGFMLSALALAGSQKAPTMVAVAIPVVSLGLPILDVAIAVVRRFLSGKPLFRGDDEHIHHRLLKRGLSQREAVLILYAVTAGFGLLSLALLHGAETIALVLAVIGIGVWLGVQYLRYAEFSELRELVQRTAQRRRILINNLALRRATESLNLSADFRIICQILKETLQPLGFDGFQFSDFSVDRIPESFLTPLRPDINGGLRCCWAHLETTEAAWELRLELVTSSRYKCGYFSLFRTRAEELLLVDLNLLTTEFRTALSDAVHRATIRAQAAVKDLQTEETHLVAKVTSASSLRQ